jgi:hypothetical protein
MLIRQLLRLARFHCANFVLFGGRPMTTVRFRRIAITQPY